MENLSALKGVTLPQFKIGDLVTLKGFNILMLIDYVYYPERAATSNAYCNCIWFNTLNEIQTYRFTGTAFTMLVKMEVQ